MKSTSGFMQKMRSQGADLLLYHTIISSIPASNHKASPGSQLLIVTTHIHPSPVVCTTPCHCITVITAHYIHAMSNHLPHLRLAALASCNHIYHPHPTHSGPQTKPPVVAFHINHTCLPPPFITCTQPLKKLGSCHMEYITSRKKIRSLLHPVDDESTRVMVVSSHCLSVNSYK